MVQLSKENIETIMMALVRIEILEQRLNKKRGGLDDEFLKQVLKAQSVIKEMRNNLKQMLDIKDRPFIVTNNRWREQDDL